MPHTRIFVLSDIAAMQSHNCIAHSSGLFDESCRLALCHLATERHLGPPKKVVAEALSRFEELTYANRHMSTAAISQVPKRRLSCATSPRQPFAAFGAVWTSLISPITTFYLNIAQKAFCVTFAPQHVRSQTVWMKTVFTDEDSFVLSTLSSRTIKSQNAISQRVPF
jgi:hypothetical protein